MLNGELCNVESTYNVHKLSKPNGKFYNTELTPYNIREHKLKLNTEICVGKVGINTIDQIRLSNQGNASLNALVDHTLTK